MKISTLLLMVALCLLQISTTNAQSTYSFKVPPHTSVSHNGEDEGSVTDIYTVHEDKDTTAMKYIVSISEYQSGEITYDEVMSDDFKDGFQKNCSCTIVSTNPISYTNFKGICYNVKFVTNGVTLVGYSYNAAINGNVFNISMLIKGDSGLDAFKSDFDGILNSLAFKK